MGIYLNPGNRMFQTMLNSSFYVDKSEALRVYINMDFDGVQADLVAMLDGQRVPADVSTFNNTMTGVGSKGAATPTSRSCPSRAPSCRPWWWSSSGTGAPTPRSTRYAARTTPRPSRASVASACWWGSPTARAPTSMSAPSSA